MVRTVLLGVAVVVAGCGRAIVTSRAEHSGVIELDGDHSKGMEEANQRMAEHCGANNYTIMKEGWEQDPPATERTWRVRYQCNTASQQVAAPAATPASAPPTPAPALPPERATVAVPPPPE